MFIIIAVGRRDVVATFSGGPGRKQHANGSLVSFCIVRFGRVNRAGSAGWAFRLCRRDVLPGSRNFFIPCFYTICPTAAGLRAPRTLEVPLGVRARLVITCPLLIFGHTGDAGRAVPSVGMRALRLYISRPPGPANPWIRLAFRRPTRILAE